MSRARRNAITAVLVLIASLFLGTVGAQPASATCYTCESGAFGAVQLNASDWLTANGGGVTAYSNGDIGTVSNDYSAPAVGMKWQCVELTQRLYQAKGWHNGFWTGVSSAYQIYDNAAANGLQAHPNNGSYVPVPGDMIVHSPNANSSAGHVSIIDRISGSTVFAVEQNVAAVAQTSAGRGTYMLTNGVLSRSGLSLPIRGIVHSPSNPYTSTGGAPPAPPAPPSGVNLSTAVYMGGDHLGIGQSMSNNRYLTSVDGRYVLLMQNDGNLVEYGPGLVPLWWSSTAGLGGAYVTMQSDGNFVMYKSDGATAVWATNSGGLNGSYLAVQNDGNLVMYQADGATAVWSSGRTGDIFTATSTGSDRINVNQSQVANTYLQSADGRYRLLLIGDGNWVLYGPGYHVLWANWANGTNGAYIVLQPDGNMVEYLSNHATAVWASLTTGYGGAYVVVQNDGNVVMYQSNGATAVWGTSTGGRI